MSIEIAIVADDLTGALDSSTSFALAGWRVAVATRPQWLPAAIASGADIVAVSTASRALPPAEAAKRVAEVAALLAAAKPRIVFKKIDSRLKGNVGAETEALAAAFGFPALLVAPATPDQGRLTLAGAVTGRGVETPIPIAPRFASADRQVRIADAACEADLDRLVAGTDWTATLAVGARGLGAAFARRGAAGTQPVFAPQVETLFAIGSRDPITEAQVAHVAGARRYEAPLGSFAGEIAQLPALLCSTGPDRGPDEAISQRFASAVGAAVERLSPKTLVMSGGDTALAILDRLGVGLVFPQGEAGAGLPWFLIEPENRPSIRAVVKSGGFGNSDALAALLPQL